MKSISASIIVFAAALLLLGGCFVGHADTRLFVHTVACGIGAAGMWGWYISIKATDPA